MCANSNHRCSYCGVRGHKISYCNSDEGTRLFNHICSRAIDYIVLERRTIHERAKMFYQSLISIYYVKELKLILSKIGCVVRGNMVEVASKFVYKYFLKYLALQQFPDLITSDDRLDLRAYLRYWRELSKGYKSIDEANQELTDYFVFVNGLRNLRRNGNETYSNCKFAINVFMKPVDLTEEQEESPSHFECAICMEDECSVLSKIELSCNHSFCESCVSTILLNSQKNNKHPNCALCRKDFTIMQVHKQSILEDYNTRFCYPC